MADFFDEVGPQIDPNWQDWGNTTAPTVTAPEQGRTVQAGTEGPAAPPAAYSGNYQGDWGSFIGGKGNLAYGDIRNNLPQYAAEFNQLHPGANIQATGRPGDYDTIQLPGGQIVDVQTSGGQNWWGPEGPGGGGGGSTGGGVGGYGGGRDTSGINMPTAPTPTDLTAPAPFSYPTSSLGQFQAPSQTPTMGQLGYNPMASPTSQTYNPMQTPTAFSGSRQADPGTLSYQNMATPAGYQAERYQGLSEADLKADPSYKFRFEQGQAATENALAHAGALRTGNALEALTNYGQGAASQEYAAADARARNTMAQNNASSLGAYQTNAQTGLAYGQANNANALNFGQANIQNQFNANEANYGRSANEAQQGFQNAFTTNQANNAGNLAFGNQNFQNQFAVNQANNQGQNAAIQGNNANALAAQGQQFGQAATGYGLNQAAQNQGYQQALGTYGLNAQTQLGYGSQNQQNQLANYQAQTNAALGLGNLNLGYQNSAQNYALGQGNLGLAQQGQSFGQGLDIYDRNYRANVTDPWNQQMGLASLGNPGAPNTQGNANAQGDLYTQQGNANAAGTVGAANQWNNAAGNIGQSAQQLAYMQWLNGQR